MSRKRCFDPFDKHKTSCYTALHVVTAEIYDGLQDLLQITNIKQSSSLCVKCRIQAKKEIEAAKSLGKKVKRVSDKSETSEIASESESTSDINNTPRKSSRARIPTRKSASYLETSDEENEENVKEKSKKTQSSSPRSSPKGKKSSVNLVEMDETKVGQNVEVETEPNSLEQIMAAAGGNLEEGTMTVEVQDTSGSSNVATKMVTVPILKLQIPDLNLNKSTKKDQGPATKKKSNDSGEDSDEEVVVVTNTGRKVEKKKVVTEIDKVIKQVQSTPTSKAAKKKKTDESSDEESLINVEESDSESTSESDDYSRSRKPALKNKTLAKGRGRPRKVYRDDSSSEQESDPEFRPNSKKRRVHPPPKPKTSENKGTRNLRERASSSNNNESTSDQRLRITNTLSSNSNKTSNGVVDTPATSIKEVGFKSVKEKDQNNDGISVVSSRRANENHSELESDLECIPLIRRLDPLTILSKTKKTQPVAKALTKETPKKNSPCKAQEDVNEYDLSDLHKLYLSKRIELLDHELYIKKLEALQKERALKITPSVFTMDLVSDA